VVVVAPPVGVIVAAVPGVVVAVVVVAVYGTMPGASFSAGELEPEVTKK